MKNALSLRHMITVISVLLLSYAVQAKDVGTELPAFTLDDAQGTEHTLDNTVLRIYATGGRKADKLLDAALTEDAQNKLNQQNAIVIAEISNAPGFVKRIIRSSLKDRSYQSWMDTKGKTKRLLPYREKQVAIIDLNARTITGIRHVSEISELQAALTETAQPATSPTPQPTGE